MWNPHDGLGLKDDGLCAVIGAAQERVEWERNSFWEAGFAIATEEGVPGVKSIVFITSTNREQEG